MFKPDTLKIAEEIRKINEAELEAREKLEEADDEDIELEEISEIIAEEMVKEELEKLDEMTDLAAIEMVAEEVMNEALNEIEDLDNIDETENEIIEGSAYPDIDFGSITEVTN